MWLRIAEWIGVTASICGAVVLAAKLSWSGWAYPLFLAGSLLMLAIFGARRRWAQVALWGTFTAINLLGIWRWLIA